MIESQSDFVNMGLTGRQKYYREEGVPHQIHQANNWLIAGVKALQLLLVIMRLQGI